MASSRYPLTLLRGSLAVCKLDPADRAPLRLPDARGALACLVRTASEASLVCAEQDAPRSALSVERGWRAFRLEGPIPMSAVGVVSGVTRPLAEAGITVFVVSTFDTDYVLVRDAQASRAATVLKKAGFQVAAEPAA